MPDTPTPGQVYYQVWQASMWARWPTLALAPWPIMPLEEQAPWDAAAQAVLDGTVHGRELVYASFRFGLGAVLRLAGSPCPWRVHSRRWVEREVLGSYAEYGLTPPEGLGVWSVEADLEPWEDNDA